MAEKSENSPKSDSLRKMQSAVKQITEERGWQKYHNPKNMAMDLVREASEALDHLVWDQGSEVLEDEEKKAAIGKELADVLHSLLLFTDAMELDLTEEFWTKLEEVKQRYPVEEIYGQSGYEYKRRQRKKVKAEI